MTHPIGVVDGTFSGTDPHAVYALQLNELGAPHIPALAELPDVGPHARGLGKVVANLSLPFELRPYGWQLQRGSRINAADQLRAISHRNSIIQAMADVAAGADVPAVSVRLLGPVSLLVDAMLPSGQRILRDAGARADVAAVWVEGVADLIRRIHDVLGARVSVFVEEQRAHDVVNGRIRTVSGADVERAVDVSEIRSYWQLTEGLDAEIFLETPFETLRSAAQVGSIALSWPVGRSQRTEQVWELIDALVGAGRPVALQLQRRSDPERYAEELIQQYLDWGLDPVCLEHVRLVQKFNAAPEIAVGSGLEALQTVADHAAGYAGSL
ncbi:hypothetical protein [Enteractinococcus coprophilus]|uniref:Uncharacterized protein n=1 Tax=Enteractinococcus coprophilus TaxID=1027633 RepID=A0A543A093_9MICC|nr:hypothetical protein [Enteractinococcus coprophilus]TQL65916.1 hypothetical protein FB556_2391 [Enteractinococcus coprophilus]